MRGKSIYFIMTLGMFAMMVLAVGMGSGCGNKGGSAASYSISGTVSGAVSQGVTMTLSEGVISASPQTVKTDAKGNYIFKGVANGSYTLTPSLSGYTFTPANSQQTLQSAPITGVNFTAAQAVTTPNPPADLTQTTINNTPEVALTWRASTGAAGYAVYFTTAATVCPASGYMYAGSVTGLAYTDTNLVSGTTYCFAVTAKNSAGESGYSNITQTTVLAVPSSLNVIAPDDYSALLTWNGSTFATGYHVYTSTTSGGPYVSAGTTGNTYFMASGLHYGNTYYFVVTAQNGNGETGYSSQKGIYLGQTPGNLQAAPGPEQAILTWNATVAPSGYTVYDGAGYVGQTGGTYSSFTVAPLTDGTLYNFTVTAVYAGGESVGSNMTGTIPMASPSSVAAIEPTYNTAQISWAPSAHALSYNVYAQQVPGGAWAQLFTDVAASPQIWSGAMDGLTYNVKVAGVNSLGQEGSASAVASLTLTPDAPARLIALRGNRQASLFWTGSPGATGYNIYDSAGSGFGFVTATTATGYTVTGLITGTFYSFTITAYNPAGESAGSNMATAWIVNPINTYSGFSYPMGIAIDASGNVWVTNNTGNTISELTYTSGYTGSNTYTGFIQPIGIAIDASGNVWVANGSGTTISELTYASGYTASNTYTGFNMPAGIAIDASGNVWVANFGSNNVIGLTYPAFTATAYSGFGYASDMAIDASGNIWVGSWPLATIGELTNSSGYTATNTYSVGSGNQGMAIDAAGNIWVTNYQTSTISELTYASGYTASNTYTGFNKPFGIAIDATGNIWVTNYGGTTISELTYASGYTASNTYTGFNKPVGIAIDASGNVWVTNSGSNPGTVTELVGVTTGPQYFPCSYFTDTSCPQFQGGGNW